MTETAGNYPQLLTNESKAVHLLSQGSVFGKYLTWTIAPFLYLANHRCLLPYVYHV